MDPADGGPHPASIKRIRESWNVKPTPRDKGLTLTVKVTAYDNGMVEVDASLSTSSRCMDEATGLLPETGHLLECQRTGPARIGGLSGLAC